MTGAATGAGAARPDLEPDLYARLGVERGVADKDLAAAYRRAARRHHPDHGGSPEAFAAVEEAFRVLRDPVARAAYDAGLRPDEPADVWADVGWGVAGDDPPPAAQAARDGVPAPPRTNRTRPPRPGRPPWRRPSSPEGPNPFAPGALALPVVDPGARPGPPVPPWLTTATAVAAGVVWLVLAVTTVVLAIIGDRPFVLLGMAPICALFVFMVARPHLLGRVRSLIPLAVPVGYALFNPGLQRGVMAAVLELALASVLTATAERLRYAHKHRVFKAQVVDDGRRAQLLHRRLMAVEWNSMREVLRYPGSRVVAAGTVVVGAYDATREVDRSCWDPLLGAAVVRRLPAWVTQGQWLVLDAAGDVAAAARYGAPDAWLAAMTGAPLRRRSQW